MISILLGVSSLFAEGEEAARRVYAHLLINDTKSAVLEAEKNLVQFPLSKELHLAYIQALSSQGEERLLLQEWSHFISLFQEEEKNRDSLEVVAWGVLNRAEKSEQLSVQFNALLGAAFTQDAKALHYLTAALRSSNAFLRTIAIKLSTSFGDGPLQQELIKMLKEEKVWYVRLEVIKAIGALRIISAKEILKEIIGHKQTLVEEKATAILALVNMYDGTGRDEMQALLKSDRAGLRQLGCQLAAYFDEHLYAKEIKKLLKDPSPDVRIEAICCLGLLGEKISDLALATLFKDSHPVVAITAGWVGTLQGKQEGLALLKEWMHSSHPKFKYLATASLNATGRAGLLLALEEIENNPDPYVKLNLALGLIGQREKPLVSCQVLKDVFFLKSSSLWMRCDQFPFSFLMPSEISHIDQIPNYPEFIDQMVRLEVLSILKMMDDPQAEESVKAFLKNSSWRITGAAASILMQEGGEESLEIVRYLLGEEDRNVRVQAALLLALRGGDPAALKVLEEAYPHVDREMQIAILEAIGRIGEKESISFLIAILKEPFQMLRVVAASALIQCVRH